MRLLSQQAGPFRAFLTAARHVADFEAVTQIPVDDTVFVLSVFAYYGKDTWPGMFCHQDVLTYYQRYERRTSQQRVTEAAPAAELIGRIAVAWGLSVEEAKRRFGPLLDPRP
jgi:hypothetical protein